MPSSISENKYKYRSHYFAYILLISNCKYCIIVTIPYTNSRVAGGVKSTTYRLNSTFHYCVTESKLISLSNYYSRIILYDANKMETNLKCEIALIWVLLSSSLWSPVDRSIAWRGYHVSKPTSQQVIITTMLIIISHLLHDTRLTRFVGGPAWTFGGRCVGTCLRALWYRSRNWWTAHCSDEAIDSTAALATPTTTAVVVVVDLFSFRFLDIRFPALRFLRRPFLSPSPDGGDRILLITAITKVYHVIISNIMAENTKLQ